MKKSYCRILRGTSNTEVMADAVVKGLQEAGESVEKIRASGFSPRDVKHFDAFAFGCPAMGREQLEDSELEPMFDA